MTANIGVLRVGGREVFLYLPTDPPWSGEFPAGSRVAPQQRFANPRQAP